MTIAPVLGVLTARAAEAPVLTVQWLRVRVNNERPAARLMGGASALLARR